MDIFTVCTIYVAFQNAAWNQFKMQRKNKYVVLLWKTTLLSKKDQSPKKSPEYKVSICIVVVGFIQKFFHINFWKKNFLKIPFLSKLSVIVIVHSMKQKYYEVYHFLLEILSEFNIGYWINFIVSCIFEIYFFQLIDHGFGRKPENTWEKNTFLVPEPEK